MDRVVRSYAAFAGALDRPRSLRETMSYVEAELARELAAERVTIELGEVLPPPGGDESVVLALAIHGTAFGRASFRFAAPPPAPLREALGTLAAPIAAVLALRSQSGERERLHDLVRTDALTGLPNRMAFDERMRSAWHRTRSLGLPLTVALIDIDYFKLFNDLYGHVEGDACLRDVANAIAVAAGGAGFVARFGGEEFAYVSESLDPSDAAAAIERIVRTFDARAIPHGGSSLRRISISAGVVSGIPSSGIEAILREADGALYRAKGLGRNRLCFGEYVSAAPVAARYERALFGVPVADGDTIERHADVARVLAALRQSRMVSLVGPPGIGKSRLAHAAALAVQNVVVGGIAYVDLAQATPRFDPMALLRSAADPAAPGATDLSEALSDLVTKPDAVLLVDNVPDARARDVAELCNDLLRTAPGLTVLATSHAALGCFEERVMVVAPLVSAGGA